MRWKTNGECNWNLQTFCICVIRCTESSFLYPLKPFSFQFDFFVYIIRNWFSSVSIMDTKFPCHFQCIFHIWCDSQFCFRYFGLISFIILIMMRFSLDEIHCDVADSFYQCSSGMTYEYWYCSSSYTNFVHFFVPLASSDISAYEFVRFIGDRSIPYE